MRINANTGGLIALVLGLAVTSTPSCGCSAEECDTKLQTAASQPETVPARRLLIIGWDGATWNLLGPMLEAGKLPNLAALAQRGGTAPLASTMIPISSAAWVAAATGQTPGVTGVYSFFEPVPGTYDVNIVSSRSNQATPIWRRTSAVGLRSIIFGMPLTYPPEEIDGIMVAGMLAPFDGEYAHPPGTAQRLRERGFVPDLGSWTQTGDLSFERIQEQLVLKEKLLLELLADEEWSLSWLVFKSLDVLSHAAYSDDTDGHVARLVELLDKILGKLITAVGPDTNVVLMSDHGFRAYPKSMNVHAWLLAEGFSKAKEDTGDSPDTPQAAPLTEQRAAQHRRRIDGLDLANTRALAGPCEGNFGSLRINLSGREPQGPVGFKGAETLLRELEQGLLTIPAPPGSPGERLVKRVWRTTNLYPGPHGNLLPDLIFETIDDVQVVANEHQPVLVQLIRAMPDHIREGVLVWAGPDLSTAQEGQNAVQGAEIQDIAPLAMHLVGMAVPEGLAGQIPDGILRPGATVRFAPDTELPRRDSGSGPFSAQELEEVRSRLQAMPYVE